MPKVEDLGVANIQHTARPGDQRVSKVLDLCTQVAQWKVETLCQRVLSNAILSTSNGQVWPVGLEFDTCDLKANITITLGGVGVQAAGAGTPVAPCEGQPTPGSVWLGSLSSAALIASNKAGPNSNAMFMFHHTHVIT
ncbi:hypothetical protein E2C01_037557 [Portunus trituberculatus]|uniref:Uncharacterized protein n=1 Tax=Portunus trituberculatus TaxID=210409 RepID=A0A5B7FBR0_PORTR|nr:hypothetical protein [Portunus trituberculatus]